MRHQLHLSIALLALAAAQPAAATVFYSNFTPSDTNPVNTFGMFPTERRVPDSSQTFDSYGVARTFQTGVVCCTFRTDQVFTQFVAPSTFTASHLILPLAQITSVGNRNQSFLVERFDFASSAWVNARAGTWATVPSSALMGVSPQVREVEVPFGTNNTASAATFAVMPITILEGQLYRIRTGQAQGGVGNLRWFLSDQTAAPGQSGQTYSYQAATALAYQPGFAFTDGGSLSSAPPPPPPPPPPNASVPEPASWLMMILGFGLIGSAMRSSARHRARA